MAKVSGLKLLGVGNNAKTVKGDGSEYLTAILYLTPDDYLCPLSRLAGCREGCLNTAGRGAFNSVQAARHRKTQMLLKLPDQFDLQLRADLDRFQRWLQGLPNKERTIVKVSFAGSINLATAAQLDQLLDMQADLFASLRKRERLTDISIVPDELDRDSVTLTGYARSAWEELVSAGAEDVEALAALRLFYRLSQQGDLR